MLVATASPNTAFFACMPSFNVIDGWMNMDQDPIFKQYLGAPKGKSVVGTDGLITRAFEGANVTLNISSFDFSKGGQTESDLNRGCVQWASGETTGTCP